MANWTDVPLPIVGIIAQYLTQIEDFASFSAVSKECHFVTRDLKKKSLLPRYPRLMLAENEDVSIRGFVNLLTSKTFGVELPEARGSYCVGAHYGWLFVLGNDLQINLLHPFSRQQICLPPMLTFPSQWNYRVDFTPQMMLDVFVRKIAISANPLKGDNLNNECIIVAIYGEFRVLGFARLGDSVWTNIQEPPVRIYEDIIYYKGKFYAVCLRWVVVCDIDGNNSSKAIVVCPAPCSCEIQKYLVESSGDLLLVCRERGGTDFEYHGDEEERDSHNREGDDDNEKDNQHNDKIESDKEEKKLRYYTTGFSVWRLDESHNESGDCVYDRTEVTTLGDRALFLGGNMSTSVVASNGIKANCIYFTDDTVEIYVDEGGGRDTGVFNMEDGTIQFGYAGKSRSKLSPPIWYI